MVVSAQLESWGSDSCGGGLEAELMEPPNKGNRGHPYC